VVVDGIVDLPYADSIFQVIGARPGASPSAPPDNVVILPFGEWNKLFAPVARLHPDAVQVQEHVKLDAALPSDPGAAFAFVEARAHNLEARLAGAGVVGNNLGAQLDAARADAVYAQLLFLFLGLPGVIVAALVTAVVAASGRERRRREQALLRIRGATPRVIVRLAAAEAGAAGLLGVGIGLGAAALVGKLAFGTAGFGATTGQSLVWVVASALAGIALALATILLPAWRDAQALAAASMRSGVGQHHRPLWARLYLDALLLAGAGLVYWQAVKSGYQVVLAPEGVPTISVSYFTLLAPLLLWLGAALLAWRVASGFLARGRRAIAAMTRAVAGGLSGVVAASMARQRRLLSRALVIMALAGSFAVSTAVFNSTYAAQARVDAELTNGADVSVTTSAASQLPAGLVGRVHSVPGVAAAEPMQHRFAYVGNDLQDLYGIDPSTIARATPMSNAFFGGGDAARTLALLASHPDGVLVSDETVKDFQLQPGDLIRLRLQFASDHSYHVVPFHYVGIIREFPTAPHDSFFITNASYVARATGSPGAQVLLVRTNGSPPAVAARIRSLLGPISGVSVHDIDTELRATLSSLTALDLSGLTRLQLGFAVALAIAASGLVLWLGLAERRRMFAIASALGARSRQLAAFVWSEAAFVTAGGLILGAVSGWLLAAMIVKILTGVFDPPPAHLFIPWVYLVSVALAAIAAIIIASWSAIRSTRRPAIEIIRDL
jgi:putative ABC transport system permease protein